MKERWGGAVCSATELSPGDLCAVPPQEKSLQGGHVTGDHSSLCFTHVQSQS